MPAPSDLLGLLPYLGLAACAVALFLLADLAQRYDALRERAQWPHAGLRRPHLPCPYPRG